MTESMTTDDAYQYGLVTGEFMERQRIIALLEEDSRINESDGRFFRGAQGKYSRTYGEALRYAVALIKGEN